MNAHMRQISVTSARENIYQLLRDLKSQPQEVILLTNRRDEGRGVLVSEEYFRELVRLAKENKGGPEQKV